MSHIPGMVFRKAPDTATECVTRIGAGKDSVAECWWTNAATEILAGTSDPELYRNGVHGRDFRVNLTAGPGRYHIRLNRQGKVLRHHPPSGLKAAGP